VSEGSSRPSPRRDVEGRWRGWLPLLLLPLALLPDLGAGLPLRSYFFRDFTATFYPLRLFAAREIRDGRFPSWNPFIFEGSFQLPTLYPPDLLHTLWPGPVFVSWLLTLHLPLAALAAWWLARELGASREGAIASGALFSLGGLALSSLNLYVFLQALALAPLVAGTLRRAALRGGRAVVLAGLTLALALSTLAVEFVGQAILLGAALGLVARPSWRAGGRVVLAALLGAGLAGLPLALMLGLLPETPRGAGFEAAVRLGNAVHPAVLLQAVLPNLFGVPQAPAEAWWGGRFFSKGLPYFLSLYIGPVFLGLGALGLGAVRRGERVVLLVLGGLGLWYALGEWGGLAPLVSDLPLARSFRFPSKALLLPYLGLSIAAAFGVDRLRWSPRTWPRLTVALAAPVAAALAVAGFLAVAPSATIAWTGVRPEFWPQLAGVVGRDAALVAVLFLAVAATAVSASRGWIGTSLASVLVVALGVGDLAHAGAGINAQVSPAFFEQVPELRAQELDSLGGGRVFSYGLDHSPAFRDFLGRGGPRMTFAGTWVSRQMLSPYSNVVDRVAVPEATDLTSFVPRPRELLPEDCEPAAASRIVPWMRNAAVARVLSLDPLESPDLELLDTIDLGPPGLAVRVYGLARPEPLVHVACRVVLAPDRETARLLPYDARFAPERDVALEEDVPASCRAGSVRVVSSRPGAQRYEVDSDGPGLLVTRESFASGWKALVDGASAPVLRANGKHRAVPVPGGHREVALTYVPPGMMPGLWVSLLSAGVALLGWVRASLTKGGRRQ